MGRASERCCIGLRIVLANNAIMLHIRMVRATTLLGILIFMSSISFSHQAKNEATEKGRLALEYVERVRNSACGGGTEETLPVEFDHAQWSNYADVAVRMANLLTKIMVQGNNTLAGVEDEFLFDLVRNNVDSKTLLFGSAIAVEEWAYPKYRKFCPYAYKKDRVYAHDISLNYDYLDPSTEWYNVLRIANWSGVLITENALTYRYNQTSHNIERMFYQPMAMLDDGHWTKPYYDCGGGDIWMVTYSSPIFGVIPGTKQAVFRGIGTIDIELTNIDINQCDAEEGDGLGSVDVFRGTHHCQPTTKCVPLVGYGFIRGAYVCECMDGYYFQYVNADLKAFNGSIIEKHFALTPNNTEVAKQWQCAQCAEGCDTCVDNTACLYSYQLEVRSILVALTLAVTVGVVFVSAVVAVNKNRKVIKSASPMFLHVMTTGAGLMCLSMFIMFIEPTNITCILRIWPQHIGFALLYGALLLKTWRISNIFKVKSARKLNLSDKVLAQRFIPILCVTVGYLTAWTVIAQPQTLWRKTNSDLKFLDCPSDYWEYGAQAGEALFLLWGAYLCFVVRKAPSQFNESKFITWAIYNNIILGSFIIITKQFIAVQEGPDVMYLVDFLYIQVSVTATMLLIFAQKIWGLRGKDGAEETLETSVTGRGPGAKEGGGTTVDILVDVADKATQTELTMKDKLAEPTQTHGTGLANNKVAPSEE